MNSNLKKFLLSNQYCEEKKITEEEKKDFYQIICEKFNKPGSILVPKNEQDCKNIALEISRILGQGFKTFDKIQKLNKTNKNKKTPNLCLILEMILEDIDKNIDRLLEKIASISLNEEEIRLIKSDNTKSNTFLSELEFWQKNFLFFAAIVMNHDKLMQEPPNFNQPFDILREADLLNQLGLKPKEEIKSLELTSFELILICRSEKLRNKLPIGGKYILRSVSKLHIEQFYSLSHKFFSEEIILNAQHVEEKKTIGEIIRVINDERANARKQAKKTKKQAKKTKKSQLNLVPGSYFWGMTDDDFAICSKLASIYGFELGNRYDVLKLQRHLVENKQQRIANSLTIEPALTRVKKIIYDNFLSQYFKNRNKLITTISPLFDMEFKHTELDPKINEELSQEIPYIEHPTERGKLDKSLIKKLNIYLERNRREILTGDITCQTITNLIAVAHYTNLPLNRYVFELAMSSPTELNIYEKQIIGFSQEIPKINKESIQEFYNTFFAFHFCDKPKPEKAKYLEYIIEYFVLLIVKFPKNLLEIKPKNIDELISRIDIAETYIKIFKRLSLEFNKKIINYEKIKDLWKYIKENELGSFMSKTVLICCWRVVNLKITFIPENNTVEVFNTILGETIPLVKSNPELIKDLYTILPEEMKGQELISFNKPAR